MKTYIMDAQNLTKHSNQTKQVFLEAMVKEKKITQELADEMNDYCVVIVEKGFFGSIWDKVFWPKKDDDNLKINVVKVLDL